MPPVAWHALPQRCDKVYCGSAVAARGRGLSAAGEYSALSQYLVVVATCAASPRPTACPRRAGAPCHSRLMGKIQATGTILPPIAWLKIWGCLIAACDGRIPARPSRRDSDHDPQPGRPRGPGARQHTVAVHGPCWPARGSSEMITWMPSDDVGTGSAAVVEVRRRGRDFMRARPLTLPGDGFAGAAGGSGRGRHAERRRRKRSFLTGPPSASTPHPLASTPRPRDGPSQGPWVGSSRIRRLLTLTGSSGALPRWRRPTPRRPDLFRGRS